LPGVLVDDGSAKGELALGATHLAALTHGYTRALQVIAALSVLGAIGACFLVADTRMEPGSSTEDGNPDASAPHLGATDAIVTMH
jgi:hypothetical protein